MQVVHKSVDTKSRKICSVPQCFSYCTKTISLHAFPSDPKLCKTWQTILKIGKPITKNMLVCSLHFVETDFFPATNKKRRIRKNVVPSKKIPQLSHASKTTTIDRSQRHWLQRAHKVASPLNVNIECDARCEVNEESLTNVVQVMDIPENLAENTEKPSTSRKRNIEMLASPPLPNVFYVDKATETEFSDFFELPQILNTDEKLNNFTGINYATLRTIMKCAENTCNFNAIKWKNLETRIILVLCKLKLNISFACLSTLFKVSNALCRTMFYATVSLLAVSLKTAIYWPTKEQILNNIPKCFQQFKNTRVILDCTEIRIQALKCLKCRVLSYSHYKGCNTLKYLIGITPSGLISFVSSGYGGRATDKAIFNCEGLIERIDANDAIMVDKGFLIEKECNEKLVKLIRPPFLRKQKQLSKTDAETTADIARARVHVERAIQRIKIFKILNHKFEWYLIPYSDEILTIIAAIVNLSPPILSDNKITT